MDTLFVIFYGINPLKYQGVGKMINTKIQKKMKMD